MYSLVRYMYTSRTPLRSGSKRICSAALLAIFISPFVTLLVCSSSANANQKTFQLGEHKLGERLSYFREKFPGASCGTPVDVNIINRKTLDDPDDSGWITCCVDEPQELAAFSKFQVLSVADDCRLRADFHDERLRSLHYAVIVTPKAQIVPEFVKSYGPVQEERTLPFDHNLSNRLVGWWHGADVMELDFVVLPSEQMTDVLYHRAGHPFASIAYVDLWRR